MYQNEDIRRHMYGNPRNIKRIFNIISLTASVVRAIQERVSCHLAVSLCAHVARMIQEFNKFNLGM